MTPDQHVVPTIIPPVGVCCDCKSYQDCQRMPEDPSCYAFDAKKGNGK